AALARRAVALDGADAEARSLLYEGALAEAERAMAMTPNLAFAHHMFGTTLIFSGRPKEGLAALKRSIRLDPPPPPTLRGTSEPDGAGTLLLPRLRGRGRSSETGNPVISQFSQLLPLARR